MKTIDILTIGNVTEDINKINNKVYKSIGGTSFYAYKVAKKLGYDLRIITEVSDCLDLSKKIDLTFHNLSKDKCLVNAKEICENILVNTNIQEYKISVVKDNL